MERIGGHFDPQEFERKYSAVYHSALAHYGTLRNAFSKIGIDYFYTELTDPMEKLTPFLGRLPDTIIAEVSGLTAKAIGKFRRNLGISVCTRRKILEAAQETIA